MYKTQFFLLNDEKPANSTNSATLQLKQKYPIDVETTVLAIAHEWFE